jgi:hypothetical protein
MQLRAPKGKDEQETGKAEEIQEGCETATGRRRGTAAQIHRLTYRMPNRTQQ